MLRISLKLDYAVRALIVIAGNDGGPVKARDIAEGEEIPERFLGATLNALRRAGLVESRRGGDGGYWLARPAEQITVADVVRAVDGDLLDVRALAIDLATGELWEQLRELLERELQTVSIASLAVEGGSAARSGTG